MFLLDTRLEADSAFVCRIADCQLRLVNDARFFWLLLIPETPDLRELHDLPEDRLVAVLRLAAGLGRGLQAATGAGKINTAAIGNLVGQLHIHIVARDPTDAEWPRPVWGNGTAQPMTEAERAARLELAATLTAALATDREPGGS